MATSIGTAVKTSYPTTKFQAPRHTRTIRAQFVNKNSNNLSIILMILVDYKMKQRKHGLIHFDDEYDDDDHDNDLNS
jgi:flagellar motor component MotA